MEETCFCRRKSNWCQIWSPPPFPDWFSDELKSKLYNDVVKNNDEYTNYTSECSEWAYPTIKPSTSVSTITQTTTAVTTLSSVLTTTSAATAGVTIALSVIFVLLVLIALVLGMWYLWKRNKRKTGSINSLPMEKYANTNYLDNKARANRSWNQSLSQQTTDSTCKGNHYGSLPPENGIAQYVQGPNRTSDEVQPESPREFDKMNKSVLSEDKLAYDNENFDKDGEESPGADSQTPLFGMIDGSGLPNVVPSIERSSLKKINETDQKHKTGDKLPPVESPGTHSQTPLFDMVDGPALPNSVPGNEKSSLNKINETDQTHKTGEKLPPVDISIRTSKSSNDEIRSPKKKKPIYLQRKSAPVGGIKDISQDMAGYRKSV